MSSIIKVNTIQDIDGNNIINESGNVITIGASGDTITVPAGATLSGDLNASNLTSGTVPSARITGAYTGITQVGTLTGLTTTGNINLGDSDVINLGASNDLQIFHSNSGSFIKDAGTSNLFIDTDGNAIELTSGNTAESMGRFVKDGAVELYHNNSKKFETAADGILVNGAANVDAGGEPSATGMIRLQANASQRQLRISPPSDSANGKIDYRGGNLTFQDDGTEVARFQDTTALMIGKSSLDYEGTAGIILRNDGLLHATRDGGNVTDFNRLSSDGEVVRFSKDGTTSGQINISGSRMNIGTGNTAIRFDSNSRLILPWNVTSNSATGVDNAIDLGASGGFGFKDLYLGGGVFLGGTGTANKLDDYEEGTWTGTISDGTNNATMGSNTGGYVKIGSLVVLTGYFTVTNLGSVSGNLRLTGLPFACGSANSNYTANGLGWGANLNITDDTSIGFQIDTNASHLNFTHWDNTSGITLLQASELTASGQFMMNLSYRTDA